ncbi:MAG: glycoside hydrolase family 172 protein, partial [Planctomycetota bacterium]
MMIHALWICFVLGLPSGELDDLPLLNGGIKRVSSYDLKEGNNDFYMVFPGQTLTLADIKGHGTIKRIYIKVDSDDPNHLRNMLLRFLWDNAEGASVDCPLGDFFALGHGRYYPVKSVAVVTGNRRGLTCYFPMPFFQRAQIFLEYEGRSSLNRIYYQIDYDPRMPPKEAGYFHAAYNQGVLNPGDAYYPVLHAEGKGKYVGLVLSMVLGEDGWFGEGDERIYVDDQNVPAVQGTGLDDLFGTAWGFEKGFNGPYSGTPVAGDLTRGSEFVGYRFHLRDPVTFSKSIDVVLEHLGERFIDDRKLGRDMSRRDEFYSVAYWYQVPPVVPFVRMPVADYRVS